MTTTTTTESPLLRMTQTTPTCLWNDSADPVELSQAIGWGASRPQTPLRRYLVAAHFICGKPRFTPRWRGSGQRLVTTLPRV